jgi:glycosyltransferase involved in cell wall biosynthesis
MEVDKKVDIVWTHSFRKNVLNSGVFMHNQLDVFKEQGYNIKQIFLKNIFNPFSFIKQLYKFKNIHPNILHAQYGSGTSFFTIFLKADKKIVSLRGSDWYYNYRGNFVEKVRSKLAILLTYVSINKFDHIIVMSKKMAEEIKLKFPRLADKVLVISDGINLNHFSPIEKKIAREKINLSFKEKKFVIGIGSVDLTNRIKNLKLAVDSIEILRKKYSNVEVLYISNVSHEDVPYYINSCDVLLLTSIYEGWPNIVKEGLACNVPFVATNVSDLMQICLNPNSFCYISDSTPELIASNIEKVLMHFYVGDLDNLYLRNYVSDFNIDIVTKTIMEVYLNK